MPRHTINPDLRPLDPDSLHDDEIDELSREEALEDGTFTPSEVSLLRTHFSPPIADRKLALDMYVRGTINQGIHRGCCRDLRASKATQERATRIDATWQQAYEQAATKLKEAQAEIADLNKQNDEIKTFWQAVSREQQKEISKWRTKTYDVIDQIDFMRKNMPPEQAKKLLHMWAQECADKIKSKSSSQG